MKVTILFILFFRPFELCQSAKILGVFNHPGASHTTLGKVLFKKLAERGHEVTMISAFPLEKPMKNYRDIYLAGFLEDLKRRQEMYFANQLATHEETKNMSLQHTMDTFENPEVKTLLQSKETFDLVVVDYFFNEGTLIFGHHFKAPVIVMSSFGNNILLNSLTGNSLPIAYVPGASLPVSDDMSFVHRLIMGAVNVLLPTMRHFRVKSHENMLKKYFTNPPTMEELQKNVALVLSNSHFSFETPRPHTPNVIPVGGLHIEELKPLSKNLKSFLDASTEGVIFFSLGSQIKSSSLNQTAFESITKAFSRVSQKVLWKWDGDDLPQISNNVRLEKWLPQKEVLAHPNVKTFVTHGGVLSMIEAIYFGVPMLFIPFNGDQPTNAAFAKSRGFGLVLNPKDITEERLFASLEELHKNQKYQKNADYYSKLMKDHPMKPIDTAIYWVEHVIRFNGASHLKPFSLNLSWYQNYMIDVLMVTVLVTALTIIVFTFIIKLLCRLFTTKSVNMDKKKKNK